MIIVGVLPDSGLTVVINLIFGQLMLLFYKVPITFVLKKIKPILPFILFTLLFFPIYEGEEGVVKAGLYIGRLVFVTQVLAYMLFKIPLPIFLKSLQSLKVPAIFIELIRFTLRFFEVIKTEFAQMHFSLKSRGFFSGKWISIRKYRTIGNMIGVMLSRSLRRADRIYLGMASRGYAGQTILHGETVPAAQWLKVLVWVVLLLLMNIMAGRG